MKVISVDDGDYAIVEDYMAHPDMTIWCCKQNPATRMEFVKGELLPFCEPCFSHYVPANNGDGYVRADEGCDDYDEDKWNNQDYERDVRVSVAREL